MAGVVVPWWRDFGDSKRVLVGGEGGVAGSAGSGGKRGRDIQGSIVAGCPKTGLVGSYRMVAVMFEQLHLIVSATRGVEDA